MTGRIVRLGVFASLLLSLVLPDLVEAAPGLQVSRDGPDFATAKYEESVVDLRVKVQGGFVRHQRRLENGIDWQFNRAWRGLTLKYAIGADPAVDKPTLIKRNEFSYKPVSGATTSTYIFNERLLIVETEDGWQWQNRRGATIDYDHNGKITAYADRNQVRVSFTYDAKGRLATIKDNNDKVVLIYAWDASNGRLTSVTDYSGRSVSYTYSTGGLLETVNDVLGEDWGYDYTDYGTTVGNLLTGITDPEGGVKTLTYEIQQGMTCVESSGGSWSFDQAGGSWGYNNAKCEKSSIQPASAILQSISDEEGLIEQYKFFYISYGEQSRYQTAIVDGAGGLRVKTYNQLGRMIEERRNGRIVSTLDVEGRKWTTTDENGRVTVVEKDTWRNPVKVTYADGTSISRSWNTRFSRVTRHTDEKGVITTYDYDANGNRIRKTEAQGQAEQRVTEYGYDSFGNRTSIKTLGDENSVETTITMTWNDFGNLKTRTDAEQHTTEYLAYDALGNVLQMKDARGKLWQYQYDGAGNRTLEQTPLGLVTTYGYDKVGNLVTVTDADQKDTTLGHDKRNRVITVTNPLGETSSIAYNGRDQLVSITNALGHVTAMEYNLDGQLIKTTDPAGNVIARDYGYDSESEFKGKLNRISYPTYEESFGYDERYRLTEAEQSSSDAPTRGNLISYDLVGNQTTRTDAKDRVAQQTHDRLNRTLSMLDTAQQLTSYQYDNRDNTLQVTNARDIAIRRYQYDKNDRLLKELLPDNTELRQQSWDANGNLQQIIDAKGQVAQYRYDDDNRLIRVQYFADSTDVFDEQNAQKAVSFGYDKLNRLAAWDDGSASGSYGYDAAGQLINQTIDYGSFSLSHSTSYYPSGLKKTDTGPDGITYTWHYDKGGRLQSVTLPGQGIYTVNSYRWNSPERVTLPGGGQIIADYDGYMRSERIQSLDPAKTPLLDARYGYDTVDNILSRDTLIARYGYDYDKVDRLVAVQTTQTDQESVSDRGYGYDAVGNRISDSEVTDVTDTLETWVYDDSDRLTSRGAISYQYDANGSRIRKTDIETGKTWNYSYNLESRLSGLRDRDDNLIASYQYDPFGRRISKIYQGRIIYYFYSQQGLTAEADAAGNVTSTYGYQPNTDWGTDPLFIKQGTHFGFYITDHLGAPQRIVGSNGAMLWSADYDAFGQAHVSKEAVVSNLRFPGQYFDVESGLHYNYLRYYDPGIGAYITSDLIGLQGGINTYGYVFANPIVYYDPSGLECRQTRRGRRCGPPGSNRNKNTTVSVFGCLGFHCISGDEKGSRWRGGPPSVGGGLQICNKGQDSTPCEKIKEEREKGNQYPVGNGNSGFSYGKFGLGVEAWQDGTVCISIGVQAGLLGPIVDGGDARP